MIVEVKDLPPETQAPGARVVKPLVSEPSVASAADSRIDEMRSLLSRRATRHPPGPGKSRPG
jgi:hypothetical protein